MKKLILLLSLMMGVFDLTQAQSQQIRGQVREAESDNPLPGASVMVRGTRIGTTTNSEGRYTLQIPSGTRNPELVVSFVGYLPQVITIRNQSEINVTLQPDEKLLDEVVVVGYATVNRRDLTGSVSSISEKQLRDIPITNAVEAMTGRLAGVQVTTSEGGPGADIRVRVRGGGSITQDNSPIYVVDGIQLDNALQTLSPQDIETIDVLKDASATAIYGARGANGVVIITTKSGRSNRTTVNYSGSTGTREILNMLPVMSPYQFVLHQYEKTRAVATDSVSFFNRYGTWQNIGQYKDAEMLDWQDKVFGRSAPYQNHNISINGGTRTTNYNLSITKNIEDGIQLESEFDRNVLAFKLDHTVSNKFKVGFNARYLAQQISGAGTTNSGSASTNRLRHSIQYAPLAVSVVVAEDEFDETYYNATRLSNPVVLTEAEYQERYTNAGNYSGYLSYQILNGLTLRSTFGYDNNVARDDNFYSKITATARNYATLPVATIRNNNALTLNNSNVLTFSKKKIGNKHDLDLMAGEEMYQTQSRQTFIETRFFPSDIVATKALSNMNLGTPPSGQTNPLPTSLESLSRILSFFGRVNYGYGDKYLLTASLRADGSTKFSPENRWGYFPSASLAWRFSEEKFMKNFSALSNGKLRLSYGEAGNNRIQDFLYTTLFNTSGVYALGEVLSPAFVSPSLANADLVWETTQSRNIGLDLEFLKGRFQFTADVYKNTTNDLLVNLPIPSTSGYTTQIKNVGSTSNQGIELQLSATPVRAKNFTWTTNFNISFNQNKVESLGPIQRQTTSSGWQGSDGADDYVLEVGQPVGLMYGFITDGWYKVDDFDYNATTKVYTLKAGVPNGSAIFGNPQPGTIKLKDLNGDGFVRLENDRTVIGDANPVHVGGWNNQFAYKGLDVSVFMNWVYGNDVYNANKIELTSGFYQNVNMLGMMEGRWMTVNSNGRVVTDPTELAALNANATIWRPITNNRPYLHSWAIEDGSFLRINNVTMGYTLPSNVLKTLKMQTLRIYATVNNLATVTNYTGFDPEVNARRFNPLTPGVDFAAYPRSRTYVLGANISF